MNTILPLIQLLKQPCMLDRHWKKLMKITSQKIAYDQPNFCLDDLIKIELNKFAEEVTELVDVAAREAKMES